MLRIVTAPFHPDLEQALVDEVRQVKASNALVPLAILVPSVLLASRIRKLLILDAQQPLLNVYILTFHQLALRIYEDRLSPCETPSPPFRIELVGDLFSEFLLSQLAQRALSGLEALRLSTLSPGGFAALRVTLRDLKDAAVDPAIVLRGLEEGLFAPEETAKLRALFLLYAAFRKSTQALRVGTADDLASVVTNWTSKSRFLSQFQRVCYYGFYDLTQVQLSLFEAVVGCTPTTLFFPLGSDSLFDFARRFFERHLLGRSLEVEEATATAKTGDSAHIRRDQPLPTKIMNAVGPEGEVVLVCKEILLLVETYGYRFDEIGVVARTLESYRPYLRRQFDEHRIPFVTTAVSPVMQDPAPKVLLQLASLRTTQFFWKTMLDVVSSPFYRTMRLQVAEVEPRPDLWQLAVRSLGIRRGEEEWRRLTLVTQVDAWAGGESGDPGEEGWKGVRIERAQVQLLRQLVTELIDDCLAIPEEGTIAALTDAFLRLAHKHLTVPGLAHDWRNQHDPSDRLAALEEPIRGLFAELRQLDRVESIVKWEDWVRLLTRGLEQTTLPVSLNSHPGVQVLDAMSARGLSFRALFILGMNEKVFPRVIREDAFLRDRERRVLEQTLGYKLDEKLSGYEEERLLFGLLKQAARDCLYFLYQRADPEGRLLAPSIYLRELTQAESLYQTGSELTLPRQFSDRMKLSLFEPSLLSRAELGLWMVFKGQDPAPFLETTERVAGVFQNGWAALRTIEGKQEVMGAYDGLTGPLPEFLQGISIRGIAPSPLEQYARCPFQYFAAQVLGLEPVRVEPTEELPPRVLGELCHAVLRMSHQRLCGKGWPEVELERSVLQECVHEAVKETFAIYAVNNGTGYMLMWHLAQEKVAELVLDVLEADQQDYHETGFRPVAFEVDVEGSLEEIGCATFPAITVQGRVDRVDRRLSPPGTRYVDYKYKSGRMMDAKDRNLLRSAIRGLRLQPPLYALMTAARSLGHQQARVPENVEFIFLAPHWEQPVNRSRFRSASWKSEDGPKLKVTFSTFLQGISEGHFFILPDVDYCTRCEFSVACRRFHRPTSHRAEVASYARWRRELRKLNATQE